MFTDEELDVIEDALDLQADVYWDAGDEERLEIAESALEKIQED